MFGKKHIEVMPKVATLLDVLYEIRMGTKYDYVYERPLRTVSLFDIPASTPEPIAMVGHQRSGEVIEYRHPKHFLGDFALDHISWFAACPDPKSADPFKFDSFSSEFVLAWSGKKNWGNAVSKGILWVGITLLEHQQVRVNSFGLDYWINHTHHGHDSIILPRRTLLCPFPKRGQLSLVS
jgi:hypothetical protein